MINFPAKTLACLVAAGVIACVSAGCDSSSRAPFSGSACSGYLPQKIDIMPLTSISADEHDGSADIEVYISLQDEFGSCLKAPFSARFELFRHVYRSADPRGERLKIWPDIALKKSAANDKYWQDFLRSYKFMLDLENYNRFEGYILQVTGMCPGGSRLTADFVLHSADGR